MHKNQLVDRLLKLVEEKKTTIARFSRDTGIPSGRIYKWKDEGNNPKVEDERKLRAWLGVENSPFKGHLEPHSAPQSSELEQLLREQVVDLKKDKELLRAVVLESLNSIMKSNERAESSLDTVVAGITQISPHLDSYAQVVLKSLARLEKRPPNALVDEASKVNNEILMKAAKQGRKTSVGN